MEGFSLLTVGQTLHYVMLLEHVSFHIVREEKQKSHDCEEQGGQYGV